MDTAHTNARRRRHCIEELDQLIDDRNDLREEFFRVSKDEIRYNEICNELTHLNGQIRMMTDCLNEDDDLSG